MILEALERVLEDHCTGADIRRIEAGGDVRPLWESIEEAGFLDMLLDESRGGAALALTELFPVLQCLGRFAVPLPVGQSIVARALLAGDVDMPTGMLALAVQMERGESSRVVCAQLPLGALADHVLACDGDGLTLLSCAGAEIEPSGDPRSLSATLTWQAPEPLWRAPEGALHLRSFAASMSAAMLSGAMQRTFDMTLDYCNTRVQFGKPLGKFQAIQQQVAVMAEHVLAGAIAAESAFDGAARVPTMRDGAIAKARTSEAAGLVAAVAHAVHGAIGMTDEYDLGLLTRRMHDWRMAYGAENHWNRIVGTLVLEGDRKLSDFVSSR